MDGQRLRLLFWDERLSLRYDEGANYRDCFFHTEFQPDANAHTQSYANCNCNSDPDADRYANTNANRDAKPECYAVILVSQRWSC